MRIRYYRIFEVRVLHEYYLLNADNLSFFNLTKQKRDEILEERLLKNQYRLQEDIIIEPTEECQRLLKNYQLRFIATATGFVVVSGGKPGESANRVKPNIEIDPNVKLDFILDVKNPYFKNYTSLPLQGQLPQNYYFTNAANAVADASAAFQSLSQPVATLQTDKSYEPGDLVQFGSGLREATIDAGGQTVWEPVKSSGFCNESDRILLPKVFTYPLATAPPTLRVELSLQTRNGVELKKITGKSEKPITAVRADFAAVDPGKPIPDGLYNLNITTNNGTAQHLVYLSDAYRRKAVGLIQLNLGQPAPQAQILDNGLMQQPHPVFEIRFRSRSTFWRYLPLFFGKKLKPETQLESFFRAAGNGLVTVRSHRLTFLPTVEDSDGKIGELPQPTPAALRRLSDDPRWYSDVSVVQVKDKIKIE